MNTLEAKIRDTKTKGELSSQRDNGNVAARIYGGDIHWTYYDLGSNWDNVSFSQVIYLQANDHVSLYSPQSTDWHGNHWQSFNGYLLG